MFVPTPKGTNRHVQMKIGTKRRETCTVIKHLKRFQLAAVPTPSYLVTMTVAETTKTKCMQTVSVDSDVYTSQETSSILRWFGVHARRFLGHHLV